jgi:hypothetical protein
MKKITIIMLFSMVFITSCYKEDILPEPQPKQMVDVFTQSEIAVSDKEEIMFISDISGIYIMKLVNISDGQVLSKEKINVNVGQNKLNLYVKTLPAKYLYLVLEDLNKNQVKKTKITIN